MTLASTEITKANPIWGTGRRKTAIDRLKAFDIFIRVAGGGHTGQADACKLGIARALKQVDSSLESILRDGKFLTRDARMKERKKYGRRGARRSFQFSKR